VTARPAPWFEAALATPASDEFAEVAGARIAYRTWGEPGLPGVVLVHGTAAHAHWWDHVGPFLAADGLRVAALSISGHGDSDWREQYSADLWADEVMAVASAAGLAGPPYVIGHSLGGTIAMHTGARFGADLAGIVIIDSLTLDGPPPAQAAQPGVGFGASRRYPSREAALDRFRLIPEQETLPYVRAHIAELSVTARDNGEWGWKFDQGLFSKMASLRAPVPEAVLKCRAAIFRAEHGLMTGEKATRLAAGLGEAVPVIVLPAGHHVMLEEPLSLVTGLRTLLAGWDAQA
jgi:pimeloyl-ACP methyl ester carboxylesterase